MLDQLLTILASNGIGGVTTAVLVYLFIQKDKELKLVHQARVADAQNVQSVLLQWQARQLEVSERLERACDVLSIERDRRR